LYSSFGKWNNWDMYDFLMAGGLPLKVERGNRVFPESDRASDVTRTLQRAMERAGVVWHLNTPVKSLILEKTSSEQEGRQKGASTEEMFPQENPLRRKKKDETSLRYCRGVLLSDGREIEADRVIVATGGLSYPSTGSTGDGYRWAREVGHTVTELRPALVPFEAVLGDGSSCKELQGLALKNVGIRICRGEKLLTSDFGEMLFTHFGVSGPVILTASSLVAEELQRGELTLHIDLKPALTEEQLDARLLRELTAGASKQMRNILGALFPSSLIPVMLRMTGIPPEKRGREITREERRMLLVRTKDFPVRLLRKRSFREAIITQGGVSVREIQPATMESKRVHGLYFAGEVLDLDASTGGYNLQIAWSTGHAAGCAGR
ncbi:MAG: aminoacetone oxidase family FAD-binding enzyme, partial [Lachnospiraceae bacterium]|nr:aminoacetone oxidase family FAD-binding enzyme [Lachnospiraceae bacterium]